VNLRFRFRCVRDRFALLFAWIGTLYFAKVLMVALHVSSGALAPQRCLRACAAGCGLCHCRSHFWKVSSTEPGRLAKLFLMEGQLPEDKDLKVFDG